EGAGVPIHPRVRQGPMTPRSLAKSSLLSMIPFGLTSQACAPVLTYHACYSTVPSDVAPIDNVHPQSLYEHLSRLQRRFQFVPVDELCEARSLRGLAAVTFDDAYKSVITHALPVLTSLNIPFTVFVNTSTLEGTVHWRHKAAYLVRQRLAEQVDGPAVPRG